MHIEPVPVRVSLTLPPSLLTVLDECRRSLPDLPNRTEMIRRAIEALASNGASHPQTGRAKSPAQKETNHHDD